MHRLGPCFFFLLLIRDCPPGRLMLYVLREKIGSYFTCDNQAPFHIAPWIFMHLGGIKNTAAVTHWVVFLYCPFLQETVKLLQDQ